jgi:hypothetical protein
LNERRGSLEREIKKNCDVHQYDLKDSDETDLGADEFRNVLGRFFIVLGS